MASVCRRSAPDFRDNVDTVVLHTYTQSINASHLSDEVEHRVHGRITDNVFSILQNLSMSSDEGRVENYIENYYDTPDLNFLKERWFFIKREYTGSYQYTSWILKQESQMDEDKSLKYTFVRGVGNILTHINRLLNTNYSDLDSWAQICYLSMNVNRFHAMEGIWTDFCSWNYGKYSGVYAVATAIIRNGTSPKVVLEFLEHNVPCPSKFMAMMYRVHNKNRFWEFLPSESKDFAEKYFSENMEIYELNEHPYGALVPVQDYYEGTNDSDIETDSSSEKDDFADTLL